MTADNFVRRINPVFTAFTAVGPSRNIFGTAFVISPVPGKGRKDIKILEIVNKNMKNQKGFSLIELLIVVVIIGIIAAIAIPNLLAARRSANEGSAVSAMRTLHGAQMTYAATVGGGNYAGTAGTQGPSGLQGLNGQGLIDATLSSGTKGGYDFAGDRAASGTGTPATFYFTAKPTATTGVTQTGTRRFAIATDGVIKSDSTSLVHFADATAVSNATPMAN
jgi:type IV pilus assembly protein PilA